MDGRLTINIISSELAGETLGSVERYRRTAEAMALLRSFWTDDSVTARWRVLALRRPLHGADPHPHATADVLRRHVGAGARGRRGARRLLLDVGRGRGLDRCARGRDARASRCSRAHPPLRSAHARDRARHRGRGPCCCGRSDQRARSRDRPPAEGGGPRPRVGGRPPAGRAAGVGRRRRLRRGGAVDRYRRRPQRRRCRHHREHRAGRARKAPRLPGVGIDAFILSGYPLDDEAERVGRMVLPAFGADVPAADLRHWPGSEPGGRSRWERAGSARSREGGRSWNDAMHHD